MLEINMDEVPLLRQIELLEKQNRILKHKLEISERNRKELEEMVDTHSNALKVRNLELEESRELLKASEARYRTLSLHDYLTELPNRAFFNLKLEKVLARAKLKNQHTALLFMDLDLFKSVNDRLGHKAGDTVLVQTAARLSLCIRDRDFVARVGGDEFGVILTDIKAQTDAKNVAIRIQEEISKPFYVDNKPYYIGVSIGISIFPDDTFDGEKLLQFADLAMYSVKKARTGSFQFFHNLRQPVQHS